MKQIFLYKFSIKQIFQEHWDDYFSSHQHPVPDYVVSTLNKILNCRNPQKLGYHKMRTLIIQRNLLLFLILVKVDSVMHVEKF